MAMSLGTFIAQFINNTCKQESYGNYYIVRGSNVDILMSKQSGPPSRGTTSVVVMRFKNTVPVIIFNRDGIKSLRREDRQNLDKVITGISFNFPSIWNVSQDLLSFRVEDISATNDVLISGSFGKFSFCGVPSEEPVLKEDFLHKPTSRKVVYQVPSTTTKAGREGIMLEGFDIFLEGVWIKILGVEKIDAFSPSEDDCNKYFNPPNRKAALPIYEVILGMASKEALISSNNYDYFVPLSEISYLNRLGTEYDPIVKATDASYREWKSFAQKFAKTYAGFDRNIFHGTCQLTSGPSNPAAYFADEKGREFVKGQFSSQRNKILDMPTWCEIKPVSRTWAII